MKRTILSLTCAAFLAMAFTPAMEDWALEIGSPAPKTDIKMKDVSGKDISLADAKRSNGLLVMFSANTCPYVIRNQSRTKEICQYALQNNIGVVLVNSNEDQRGANDSFEAMKAYASKEQYTWYYVVDKNSELADAFAADRTPECFLFDKNLKLVYKGAIDDHPGNASEVKDKFLKNAINAALQGKSVTPNSTASIGCNIKRKM
ncbi:redoxin [Chitinophaga skermanii]|uniref:Redoxin n=1 Tax=Chitinophaga skermanii TaxID=331697 RepID=A0A327QLR4_9BACT|nr:thioredoxin family protein [Chitinophaga skermanii]RAJ05260.1 redoxin [Chitinophaga skermanii]